MGRVDDDAPAIYGARMIEPSDQLLRTLRQAHRELDDEIERLRAGPDSDQLEIARLKKRKLRLRDEIARAADAAIPDMIA